MASRESSSESAPLLPVLLVNFIATLGYSIVLPFLVFLVLDFGGNAVVYGVVGATYPALQLVGAPILGRWSDRYGRKRILLLSQAGTLLSWCVFAAALYLPRTALINVDSGLFGSFTVTLPLAALFAARALDGLTGGNVSVANAYVADITTAEERSEAFGKMGVSSNLGFIVGPALAALLGASALGESLPVFAALLISLVGTILIAVLLPESSPCSDFRNPRSIGLRKVFGQEPRDCVESAGGPTASLADALRKRHVPLLLALYFVVFLGFSFFYASFPIHAAGPLGWTVTQTGLYFAALSAMMVVVQGPLLSRVSRRYAEPSLILVGGLVLATNFLLLLSGETVVIYLAAALFALGNGIMWPSVLSLMSRVAGERLQGAVQGGAGALGGLASGIGLIVSGVLYARFGELTFVMSAILICVSAVMVLPLFRLREDSAG